MIEVSNLYKSYQDLEVLKGVTTTFNKGEIVSIVGASGAGKSTFLQILGTLDKADSGMISFDGNTVSDLSSKALAEFRNKHIGFVFQFHHLLPEFNALENICLPGLIAKRNKKDVEKEAMEILSTLGLEQRAHHKPSQLSGGEQQRVSVGRALINNPKVIMADEPSGNLDSANAKELHELFFQLRKTFNQSFIIVTHNNDLARMADRTLVMKDGVILN